MAEDQTEHEALLTRIERLELLLMIGRMMSQTTDQETLITNIALAVGRYLDADRCSIFFHDRITDELYTHLALRTDGVRDASLENLEGRQIRIPSDVGIAGHVFKSGEPMNVQDVSKEPLFTGQTDKRTGFVTRNILAHPIKNRAGRSIGVLQLLNKQTEPNYFTDDDLFFVGELVEQIEHLLELILKKDELAKRNEMLEKQMQELSSFEYLIGDRTAINAAFRHNRWIHYWAGVVALVFLLLMAVTSIGMVHFDSVRKVMLALHNGTYFGLGHRYYFYTDFVSILTILVSLSGLLMYVYPPFNRWLKAQKERIVDRKLRGNGRPTSA